MSRFGRAQPAPPFIGRPLPPLPGVLTIIDFAQNTGALQPSTSGNYAQVFDATGATLLLTKTFSVDAGADATISDSVLIPGTSYRVATFMANGNNGIGTLVAT